MKNVLTSNFCVQEFHPIIEQFPDTNKMPTEMKKLKDSLNKSNQKSFKKKRTLKTMEKIFLQKVDILDQNKIWTKRKLNIKTLLQRLGVEWLLSLYVHTKRIDK